MSTATHAVAMTLTRSTSSGMSTQVETKLLMWIGVASNDHQAIGMATEQIMTKNPGFALQMYVVSAIP